MFAAPDTDPDISWVCPEEEFEIAMMRIRYFWSIMAVARSKAAGELDGKKKHDSQQRHSSYLNLKCSDARFSEELREQHILHEHRCAYHCIILSKRASIS